jgi:hypothetical protein
MANLYKRGSTWSYQVNGGIDPATEKRIVIGKGGFRTKTEAKHAAERIEKEVRDGTHIKETNITFGILFKNGSSTMNDKQKKAVFVLDV